MAKAKRRAIPRKVRFEVFKRDSFTCQYCGAMAPDVVLQIDHIIPVVKGGTNSLLNLVAACQGCNSGKGGVELSDDASVKKSKRQADELQARSDQIMMIAEWQKGLSSLLEKQVDAVNEALSEDAGWMLSDSGRKTIKKILRRFSLSEVLIAVGISRDYYFEFDADGTIAQESFSNAISKIGGICWNRKHRDNL